MTTLRLSAALLALLAAGACSSEEEAETAAPEADIQAESTPVDIPDAPANPAFADNARESAAWLEENAGREGVRMLENGIQFETLEEGEGEPASAEDYLRFHYTASFPDGTVFASSRDIEGVPQEEIEPQLVRSFEEIPAPGLPQGLAQMREGERARIAVPPEAAYGEQGVPGAIEPNLAIIFEVEMEEIITPAEEERRAEIDAEIEAMMAEQQAELEARQAEQRERFEAMIAAYEEKAAENLAAGQAFLQENASTEGVETTQSGLQYMVVEDGGSGASPDATDEVTVHYRGTLRDGTEFDSSYSRGEPTSFPLNQVIPGWTEGLQLMNVGDTYRFFVPAELAYGEQGTPPQRGPQGQIVTGEDGLPVQSIGPNETLIFEVELLEVEEGEAPAEPAAPAE